jgi:predicted nucleotidyltransferase
MRYKTIMLGANGYAKLASAKRAVRKKSGLKLSFEDLILDLIGRNLDLAPMDERLKLFIKKASLAISELPKVDGILLYGSVAKGSYNQYSDIDIAIFTSGKKLDVLKQIITLKGAISNEAIALMKLNLPHALSPMVLDKEDTKTFKPFYFDLADFGIILYERGGKVSDFVNSIKWKEHRRQIIKGVEVISW